VKSCFAAALGIMLSAAVASAQSSRLTVDVSAARMRYADTVNATAFSLAPQLNTAGRHASLAVAGMLSTLGSATTASGELDASFFPAGRRRLMPVLELSAGGSRHSDGSRTGEMLASARLQLTKPGMGAWFGGGAGRTWVSGTWRETLRGDVGGWLSDARDVLTLVANPTAVDDTIRYLDAVLAFERQTRRVELGASLGARAGDRVPTLPANRKVWGGVTTAFWMTPDAAVVASAGSYPVDFTQGYPGGRYMSLGLRFAPRRFTALTLPAPREPVSAALRSFSFGVGGDSVTLRVLAPSAKQVEVTGDFTAWEPLPLRAVEGGWWVGVVRAAAGTHQMNVRVDAGAWVVPPGLTPITDEFGVVSGLLVIEK